MDQYLAGYVNLAGTLLGLPKALSPMLSGGWGRGRLGALPMVHVLVWWLSRDKALGAPTVQVASLG